MLAGILVVPFKSKKSIWKYSLFVLHVRKRNQVFIVSIEILEI